MLLVYYVYCICLDYVPSCIKPRETGLQILKGEENPEVLS
jgi:hypothetical protein